MACKDRASQRHHLITSLLEMLYNGERKCYVFLRAALAHFEVRTPHKCTRIRLALRKRPPKRNRAAEKLRG